MTKKILIVCHDHMLSGANLSLCDYLSKSKYVNNVIIILPRKNDEFKEKLKKIGVDSVLYYGVFNIITHINKISLFHKFGIFIKKLYNLFFKNSHQKKILKILQNKNIDFVISNSSATTLGYEVAKRLNVEHVYHIREFMDLDHQITYEQKIDIKSIFQDSHAVFISNSIRDYYLQKHEFKSWKVIYNTIKYDENYKRDRLYFEDGKINVIITGTLQNNKGQLEAIKAIENLKEKYNNIFLYICGDGPNKNLLKKYIENNDLNNIYLLGHRKDVSEIRKNMDISLVCSSMEALGRVTIESMYYENIVGGANTGETQYLIEDNRGVSYNVGNYEDLANKIDIVINTSKANLINMAKNAKKYAIENFYTSKDILNLISDLVNEYRSNN